MSRSGYTDDCYDDLAIGRWRGAVKKSIEGKRGQALLKELLIALDETPDKKLYRGNFQLADGGFCTLGVLGNKRGIKMDDLIDDDFDGTGCDTHLAAERFGIANAMLCEIMFMNDDARDYPENENGAESRWLDMRDWVAKQIKP
jgi:hypothetical protein